jgi:hypothetical protein
MARVNPPGFDKNRGAIFGRRGLAAAVRSEAEDERPSPAASNPTLSTTLGIGRSLNKRQGCLPTCAALQEPAAQTAKRYDISMRAQAN